MTAAAFARAVRSWRMQLRRRAAASVAAQLEGQGRPSPVEREPTRREKPDQRGTLSGKATLPPPSPRARTHLRRGPTQEVRRTLTPAAPQSGMARAGTPSSNSARRRFDPPERPIPLGAVERSCCLRPIPVAAGVEHAGAPGVARPGRTFVPPFDADQDRVDEALEYPCRWWG